MSNISGSKGIWPFAPLKAGTHEPSAKTVLKGIVFDVDGTLCK